MPTRVQNPRGLVWFGALFLVSCSKPEVPVAPTSAPLPTASAGFRPPAEISEDEALLEISGSLRRARLLRRPDTCYAFRYDPSPGQPAVIVEVRENHRSPECGGDPDTQPHLFFVRLDKHTRALSDDAQQAGDFQPLQP